MKKREIILLGVLASLVGIVVGLYVLVNSKPENNRDSFYYPYDDMDFLEVEHKGQANADTNLADEFKRMLYKLNTSNEEYTSSVISISKEDTQRLQRVISSKHDNGSFNVAYIDCMTSDDRCVVTFICNLVENHSLSKEEASKSYCNKIYCVKENDMWSVVDIFIVP